MHVLADIAALIDAELIGDPSAKISSIASNHLADSTQLTYFLSHQITPELRNSRAGAIIIHRDLLSACPTNALVVDDVHLAFAKVSHLFKKIVLPTQHIAKNAHLNNAKIAPNCVIGEQVQFGKNCILGANVVIEDFVVLGDNVQIAPNVSILRGCTLGNNVSISPGAVIGSEGFGNARDADKHWHTIAHLGAVVIGNNVTIGANTTIDRGTIEDTRIGNGVRLDNLIHIAHNVIIGEHTAIAAGSAIAGSVRIGKRCMISGLVGVVDHLSIGDDIIINGSSTVDKNLTTPGTYTGIVPLMPHKKWQNVAIWLIKLDKIASHLNLKLNDLKGK